MTTNPMAKQDQILASVQDDAKAIHGDGPRKQRLADALVEAKGYTAKGTEDACKAALATLAKVQDEAKALKGVDNKHVKACVSAAEVVPHQLQAITWTPALPVLSVGGFADMKPGDTGTLSISISPPPATDVIATVVIEGLSVADIADGQLTREVTFRGAVAVAIPFAAQNLTTSRDATVKVTAPGVKLAQVGFSFRLLANYVAPPVLTLTGPGDVTPSTTSEVDASAVLAVSAPTDQPVAADWALSGNVADDFLGDTSGHVVVPPGKIPLRVAPLTLTADRAPVSLTLENITGAAPPFPAPAIITLRANSAVVVPVGNAPPPIDPASYALQAQADPSSFSRVTNGLKPGTAVLLAPGHYGFTNIHVPNVLYYAAGPGVFADGRVELHTPDTAVLGLDIGGGIVLDGDRARASRCLAHGSDGVDLVSAQGADNVLDRCEVYDFAGIGVGVQAKTARRPVMYGLHVHSQRSSGPPSSGTVFMIGHSHVDSDQPVQGYFGRILMEGSRSHDGFEVKCSDVVGEDITAIGCDVMQRHGLRAATFRSCWAEPQGGQGGRIQLNANNPKAIRCHGHLAVAAGNGSEADVIGKGPNSGSIYPYADGAEVHHHDGLVEIGNLYGPDRHMPPVGTLLDACPAVKTVAGTYGAATPIPVDKLPPVARRLTAADVGPSVA